MSKWRRGLTRWSWIPAGLLCCGLIGCGPSDKNASADAETPPPAPALPPLATEEPLIIDAPQQPQSEADRAWLEVQRATETPDPPEAWLTQKPSDEELEQFKRRVGEQLAQAADKATNFYTRFPEHEQSAEARRQEVGLLNFAIQLGQTNLAARVAALEAARLQDPSLSEDERLELRLQQLQRTMAAGDSGDLKAALIEMEQGVRALRQEFPKREEVSGFMLFVAERWLEINEAAKAVTLAKEVAAADADAEIQAAAQELQRKAERLGKPLDLKFTALDGREVDLAKLRGKVVLVDFWATWCRPCMVELPSVKAAYAKLKEKGFEILGISFDQDRKALERVVQQEQMTWPQYFETEKDENQFGDRFDISSIPTMWLVDKQGVLRDLSARDRLTEKVEKLLAE